MNDDERKARILIKEAKKSPTDTLTRMIRKATASTIRKYMKDGHGILLSVPQSATLLPSGSGHKRDGFGPDNLWGTERNRFFGFAVCVSSFVGLIGSVGSAKMYVTD